MPCSTLVMVFVLLLPATAAAETARDILDEVRAANEEREPNDFAATTRMTHFRGEQVGFVREIRNYAKRYDDGRSKALAVFLSPFDVKGVRFLAWEDPEETDQQWLYLPSQGRVRRIAPTLRTQSFQGFAFTYEDLELLEEMRRWTETDAPSRLLHEREDAGGVPCAVIELVPRRDDSSYGRIVLWTHRPDATLRRVKLYDRAGELSKSVRFDGFRNVDGALIPWRVEIENVTGERTLVETLEAEVNPGLGEGLFDPSGLGHAS